MPAARETTFAVEDPCTCPATEKLSSFLRLDFTALAQRMLQKAAAAHHYAGSSSDSHAHHRRGAASACSGRSTHSSLILDGGTHALDGKHFSRVSYGELPKPTGRHGSSQAQHSAHCVSISPEHANATHASSPEPEQAMQYQEAAANGGNSQHRPYTVPARPGQLHGRLAGLKHSGRLMAIMDERSNRGKPSTAPADPTQQNELYSTSHLKGQMLACAALERIAHAENTLRRLQTPGMPIESRPASREVHSRQHVARHNTGSGLGGPPLIHRKESLIRRGGIWAKLVNSNVKRATSSTPTESISSTSKGFHCMMKGQDMGQMNLVQAAKERLETLERLSPAQRRRHNKHAHMGHNHSFKSLGAGCSLAGRRTISRPSSRPSSREGRSRAGSRPGSSRGAAGAHSSTASSRPGSRGGVGNGGAPGSSSSRPCSRGSGGEAATAAAAAPFGFYPASCGTAAGTGSSSGRPGSRGRSTSQLLPVAWSLPDELLPVPVPTDRAAPVAANILVLGSSSSSGGSALASAYHDNVGYAGVFGRLVHFHDKLEKEKEGLIRQNPAAYQEDVAAQAEAEHRLSSERARLRFDAALHCMTEPRLVEDFMKSLTVLRSQRPYFLPPVLPRERVERPCVEQLEQGSSPQWTMDGSIFEQRKKECEAGALFNTEHIKGAQFALDWGRIASKPRFRRLVGKEDRGVKESAQQLEDELGEVRTETARCGDVLRAIFNYYSMVTGPMSSEDILTMSYTQWLHFCNEAGITDNTQRGCSTADLHAVFLAVNIEDEKNTLEADANVDDCMMRFEFYEGVVRAAFGKFITTKYLNDASDAVLLLLQEIITQHVPPQALVDPDEFRREHFYTPGVESLLKDHQEMLQAMFKMYKARDRTKYFWIEHWAALLESTHLFGPHTGLDHGDAKLLFIWSQMMVSDELKRRKRAVGLMFFDFLEALARLAHKIDPPSGEDMEALLQQELGPEYSKQAAATGGNKLAEYYKALGGRAGHGSQSFNGGSKPSSSPGPLHLKLRTLLEYMVGQMMHNWGGKDELECAARMKRTAAMVSGGIELG